MVGGFSAPTNLGCRSTGRPPGQGRARAASLASALERSCPLEAREVCREDECLSNELENGSSSCVNFKQVASRASQEGGPSQPGSLVVLLSKSKGTFYYWLKYS